MKNWFILLISMNLFAISLKAQVANKKSVDVNEVEISVKKVLQYGKLGDSVLVELELNSYLKNPRELKLNSFSTGVVNPGAGYFFYDTIKIGKVVVSIRNRQNYIHYLLKRDEPVLLSYKAGNWKKQWGVPKQFKIAIEDFQEEGKILEYVIDL